MAMALPGAGSAFSPWWWEVLKTVLLHSISTCSQKSFPSQAEGGQFQRETFKIKQHCLPQ